MRVRQLRIRSATDATEHTLYNWADAIEHTLYNWADATRPPSLLADSARLPRLFANGLCFFAGINSKLRHRIDEALNMGSHSVLSFRKRVFLVAREWLGLHISKVLVGRLFLQKLSCRICIESKFDYVYYCCKEIFRPLVYFGWHTTAKCYFN